MAPFCRASVIRTVIRTAGESTSGMNLSGGSWPSSIGTPSGMPKLDPRLFGPLRVLLDGEPVPRLRTRSVEWLLALLVLRHGRAVDRSWLAGTFWPESDESAALHNLRNDLVHLRKALGVESGRIQSPTRN